MGKSPIPRSMLVALRLPGVNRATLALLRRVLKKRRDLFPEEALVALDALVVHDLLGNVDLDGDGRAESFRIGVTNLWFDQRLRGAQISLSGRPVPPRDTLVRVGERTVPAAEVWDLAFDPGVPMELIARGRCLGAGLHMVEVRLDAELALIYAPIPVHMCRGRGRVVGLEGDPGSLEVVPPPEASVHFVPHIHYDVEWLRPRGVFERVGARNLLEVLRLLDEYPDCTFVLDQQPQLESFRRRHPEAFARLADRVREGRIEIANGLFAEPDTNLVAGESLVMGSVLFQRWALEAFGKTCPVGWLIDSFGQSAQLPQILARSGTEFLAFSRVIEEPDFPAEFLWEGIDGTRIACHVFPLMYFAAYPIPEDGRRARVRLSRLITALRARSTGREVLLPSGIDHGRPQSAPARHIPAWNREFPGTPIVFSTPGRFFRAVPLDGLAVRTGEFQRIFPGVWSIRPRLKQLHRRAEALLEEAEKLATLASLQGMAYPAAELRAAWETLLAAQFHDRICGCLTDEAAESLRRELERLVEDLERLAAASAGHLAARLAPSEGQGARFLVLNPHSFETSEWIELTIDDAIGMDDHRLLSPEGPLEFQVLDRRTYEDGALKSLRIGFVARLPPLGYRVFHFAPAPDLVPPVPAAFEVNGEGVRGPIWNVRVDAARGTIRRIEGASETLRLDLREAGGLLLERDLGEQMIPRILRRGRGAREKVDRVLWTEKGPLRATLRTEGTIGRSPFVREIAFYRDLRRIDVTVRIDFRDPRRRLRAVIGTGLAPKTWTHEIPYGAIERPGRELPAHRWADVAAEGKGLAILNYAIAGHELTGRTAYLSLLRSQDKIHFFESGPGGLSLGGHEFRYALVPHRGDFRDARLWQRGRAFVLPPRIVRVDRGAGHLPTSHSFLRIQPGNIVASAMRRTDAGAIELRLVECAGRRTSATLEFGLPVQTAHVTDLLGRLLAPLPVARGRIEPVLGAFEILTLHIVAGR